MDDSFMSIGSFDEENFLGEAFSEANDSQQQNPLNSTSNDMSTNSVDIRSLLDQPFKEPEPKTRLDFDEIVTPKNNGRGQQRKRKNASRRCLSTDFNDSSLSFEDNSFPSFDSYRQSKEPRQSTHSSLPLKKSNVLSSIENTLSPKGKEHKFNTKFELTPEFNFQNNTKNDENKMSTWMPPFRTSNKGGVQLQKSYSENHASIMKALQVSSSNENFIGDFSKPFVLPLLTGAKHQDLKSISCHVLANLINGQYSHLVETFTVVDCRYPYEFEGGHIQNAINLYTQESVLNKFLPTELSTAKAATAGQPNRRHILIFHCEFSSERGPSMYRFLRNKDRIRNAQSYPYLNYPEVYLLEGGYKDFYTHYSFLCEPNAYLPMHSREHENELRKFRSVVRSQSFDIKMSVYKRSMNF